MTRNAPENADDPRRPGAAGTHDDTTSADATPADATPAADAVASVAPGDELSPDDEALLRAAAGAPKANPTPAGWQAPRSLTLLAVVIVIIVGMGVSLFVVLQNLQTRNARIRMDVLEQRESRWHEQETYRRRQGIRPAGEEVKPLSADEQAELERIRRQLGVQRKPLPPLPAPRDEAAGTTVPATVPG